MSSIEAHRNCLNAGGFDQDFTTIHSRSKLDESRKRLTKLLNWMEKSFNPTVIGVASAPGRTELGGNHTDHNNGRVLAAAINLDCLATFSPVEKVHSLQATILSENYKKPIIVDLSDTAPRTNEEGTSEALVRGVADGFLKAGYKIGGFNACVCSTIPTGSGLSSSAAFEVLIGRIFNFLFNQCKISPLEIARIARRAENIHFAKPCGFMDQTASSYEGILKIDFKEPDNPIVEQIVPGFKETVQDGFYGTGYRLCVVDTGGSHADLTSDYAAIRQEMQQAAQCLRRNEGRGISLNELLSNIELVREQAGDRAVLRLFHFINEDERAAKQAEALHAGDMPSFLHLVSDSGRSSCRLLQNCYSPGNPKQQPIPTALYLTEMLLNDKGVGRVHGGGFAGTIQAYIQNPFFDNYKESMEKVFGKETVIELAIRQPGHEFLTISKTRTARN